MKKYTPQDWTRLQELYLDSPWAKLDLREMAKDLGTVWPYKSRAEIPDHYTVMEWNELVNLSRFRKKPSHLQRLLLILDKTIEREQAVADLSYRDETMSSFFESEDLAEPRKREEKSPEWDFDLEKSIAEEQKTDHSLEEPTHIFDVSIHEKDQEGIEIVEYEPDVFADIEKESGYDLAALDQESEAMSEEVAALDLPAHAHLPDISNDETLLTNHEDDQDYMEVEVSIEEGESVDVGIPINRQFIEQQLKGETITSKSTVIFDLTEVDERKAQDGETSLPTETVLTSENEEQKPAQVVIGEVDDEDEWITPDDLAYAIRNTEVQDANQDQEEQPMNDKDNQEHQQKDPSEKSIMENQQNIHSMELSETMEVSVRQLEELDAAVAGEQNDWITDEDLAAAIREAESSSSDEVDAMKDRLANDILGRRDADD